MTNAIPTQLLEIASPLVLGAIVGQLYRVFCLPWVLSRLRGLGLGRPLERLASPKAALVSLLPTLAFWLFLAVWCHPSNAPQALAWLTHHSSLLPVTPTPSLLQGVFYAATFFCGYTLAGYPEEPVSAKER
ncbi:hypothetical protein [Vitiosangium sp. GDMCC 1.1324]|uniref:hypothetical protein n=1 Tax=Vitiosangium sp. (strain GDMCC 1.1324) TaxID=2138576 RepID=UPI000D367B08|nr:hypothetical protein [Vitiosangium sp. GDMCC 1.1324]PTL77237.1 hypothetical protein DAT35_45195 [Vitiosangium sp. GDMCC 1.1324]